MPEETEAPKKFDDAAKQKLHEGTKKYNAAMEAGDKKLAAEIYKEYKLPYSAAH